MILALIILALIYVVFVILSYTTSIIRFKYKFYHEETGLLDFIDDMDFYILFSLIPVINITNSLDNIITLIGNDRFRSKALKGTMNKIIVVIKKIITPILKLIYRIIVFLFWLVEPKQLKQLRKKEKEKENIKEN